VGVEDAHAVIEPCKATTKAARTAVKKRRSVETQDTVDIAVVR
jgi:hypothetical protein